MIILIILVSITFCRNPFFRENHNPNIIAHGLKPKPFIMVVQNHSPVFLNINDKFNDNFTIKDINKNNYILVDNYGKEYICNFV
jgi:hypothetical protein